MTSGNTTPTTVRNMCKHPGCGESAAPSTGPGRPPEYCEGRGHTKVTAWRERRRLAAAEAGVEAVRAAAEQRAASADARAAAAEQRAAEADQWRAEADAAADEMTVQ